MRTRIASAVAVLLAACSGEIGPNTGGDGSGSGIPFEPVAPSAYVPKVKNLLTGLAATDAEVAAVVADPNALKGLIDQWMQAPEFETRMEDFFRNAFQQNNVSLADLGTNLGGGVNFTQMNNNYRARLERTLMDSFPLTVWELVKQGRPFTEALTTNRYMLTTAQLAMLEYSDERPTDDANKTTDRLQTRAPIAGFTLDPNSTATLEQTLDPANAKYMQWHDPVTIPATCTTITPVAYTGSTTANYRSLYAFLFGQATYDPCYTAGQSQQQPPILTDADFTDWHMVTIHPIGPTEATSPTFWNIVGNRAATDINLHVPRIGFTGTFAFATNWGTNSSNEARVTANQALIVAIGQSIAGENSTSLFPVNAVDSMHASDPACAGCHNQLDPMKQYFRQSWTLNYHDQQDTAVINQPAGFNIGANATGSGIGDLMQTLANHPRFGAAWVQKLQFWANSTPAEEGDPEVQRIAEAFKDSGFDFKTLVRETFSSPLVTWATSTQTTRDNGVILSIARRDQYCAALSNRLGLPDVCGMATPLPTAAQKNIAGRALLMPVDTYYRAFALPSLPTNPDLFFRSSTEAVCTLIANQVVDAGAGSRYLSTDPTTAIADMVATVMNVPPADPRSAPAIQILTEHFASASATTGVNAAAALKSTFTTACLAPSSVIVGL